MLILSARDVACAVADLDTLAIIDEMFRETASGDARVPPRIKASLDERGNRILVMAAYLPRANALASKAVSVFPGNEALGLPLVTGAVLVQHPDTGLPLAVIDGASITDLRTAGASAVATRALARTQPRSLAIIGAGAQGRAHFRLLAALYAFEEVRVCARRLEHARTFAAEHGPRVRAVATPEEAVEGADIVVTATTAPDPVLRGAWLAPGAHVCAVGSAARSHRELDSEVLTRAAVIAVDTRDGALAEAGDLLIPIDEGRLSAGRVAELGEILDGRRPGRAHADDVTVYKGVGTAALDAALAAAIYRRAADLGIGVEVPFMAE